MWRKCSANSISVRRIVSIYGSFGGKDGNIDSESEEYCMKVHSFGAAGRINYGMKYLGCQDKTEHPAAANLIQKLFYVDDSFISIKSVAEDSKLVKETQAMCAQENLHLYKFVSSSREVLASIDVAEHATEIRNVDLNIDILPTQRILGVEWNTESDTFSFRMSLMNKPTTQRRIHSMVAAIYDPLGFLLPSTLLGKGILQEMGQRGINWDEQLPKELEPRWES